MRSDFLSRKGQVACILTFMIFCNANCACTLDFTGVERFPECGCSSCSPIRIRQSIIMLNIRMWKTATISLQAQSNALPIDCYCWYSGVSRNVPPFCRSLLERR
jgi:hypothetical protein